MHKTLLVITTAGRFDLLKGALDSLRGPLDVLVVDDATPDPDRGQMLNLCSKKGYGWQTKTEPKGLTDSWNIAYQYFKATPYEVCILTNNDVLFPKGFSIGLVQTLLKTRCDIVTSLTNQPGFQPLQGLPEELNNINPTPENIDEVQRAIEVASACWSDHAWFPISYWNGFCFAFTKDIDKYELSPGILFRPDRVNIHNEGELAQRIGKYKEEPWQTKAEPTTEKIMCSRTSYVYHIKNQTLKNCGPSRQQLWR